MHAYTLIKKCEAKQSIVSESDRHGGLFRLCKKQSTGLFLPNQRFGVLVGGSSPRIIIDNIKKKKKSNTNVLLGADRRTLKEERRTTKQSTGLFLPNQRFGVLVGGSSPRIIIDNIKEKKKATPKCCLELIGGLEPPTSSLPRTRSTT